MEWTKGTKLEGERQAIELFQQTLIRKDDVLSLW